MALDQADRQGFLGKDAPRILRDVRVAVVGLGGGGSHVVQQLAHVGVLHYSLYDPDVIEESNLNRLVGGTHDDVDRAASKVEIARRVIRDVRPEAVILGNEKRWEDAPEDLRNSDLVFSCLDGFAQRRDLEAMTRRYAIPLIDIGMGVHKRPDGESPLMCGHVLISMPGHPCMRCFGFLNDLVLKEEAAGYGFVGVQPQVVWANGVLASTAVGFAIDLLTDWTRSLRRPPYLEYVGNQGTLKQHPLAAHAPTHCQHYPWSETGEPRFTAL
jgi:hypothetical protein